MKKKLIKMVVTEQEEELIMAIRNYVKSFPRGYPQLLYYATKLFEIMTDMPKETEE
jgi:hypothetical protein